MRKLLRMISEEKGFDVVLADSPQQARQILSNENVKIDFTYLDVNYYGTKLTGFDLAKEIKESLDPQWITLDVSLLRTLKKSPEMLRSAC